MNVEETKTFHWGLNVSDLQTNFNAKFIAEFTKAKFQFNFYLISRNGKQIICIKIESQLRPSQMIDLISLVIFEHKYGPAYDLTIPIRSHFDFSKKTDEIETDLTIERIRSDGFEIEGNISIRFTLSPIPESEYFIKKMPNLSINIIIQKILSPHSLTSKSVLNDEETYFLCEATRSILIDQPNLLRLKGPIVLVGDLHGKYFDMIRTFIRFGFPDRTNYLFLGDYVDRGSDSVDIIYLLFALKVRFPNNIFLLRGNHECSLITTEFGFKAECTTKGAPYDDIINVFNYLPFAAVISGKIFVTHGGVSPGVSTLEQIENIPRPIEINSGHYACDLLWGDPKPGVKYFGPSIRGAFTHYGKAAVFEFLDKLGLELLVRAHEVVEDGFEFPFGVDGKCITLFSATDQFMQNHGAVMIVGRNLNYSFYQYSGLNSTQEKQYEQADFNQYIYL